ncbi:MAG: hypothetical protein ACP5MT_00020 [Candidatus Acidifodinimicrobium sp.]
MSKQYRFEAVLKINNGRKFGENAMPSLLGGFTKNDRFRLSARIKDEGMRIHIKATDISMLHSVMNTAISTIKSLEMIDKYE